MRSILHVTRHGLPALVLVVGFLGIFARGEVPGKDVVKDPDAPSALSTKTTIRRESLRDRLARRFLRQQSGSEKRAGPAQEPDSDPRSTTAAQPDQGPNTGSTDLTVPRAERGDTGTQPTVAEQVEKQPARGAAPEAPTPLILNRVLGLEDAPFRVFGWIENSFTGNANGLPRNLSNFSVFPNRLADQWQGNQYYFVVENPLEPNDMVNLGFRVDTLFGNDWQFTKSYGFFDGAFTPNQFAGLDLPQLYGEIHLPILTPGGLDIKGGRFYSPAGFSAVPAISRPFVSVPYSMNYTPFTFLGAMGTLHLTDRINLIGGTINGFDRWIDSSYKWGFMGFATWKSRNDKTNLVLIGAAAPDQLPRFAPANSEFVPTATTPPTPALAGRINPFYGSSYRQFLSLVLTHQWTEKLTQAVETDHIWDPKIIGFSLNGAPSSIAYHGLVNWFLYSFTDKLSGGWRGEVFWDPYGAATGSRSTYYETSVMLTEKLKPWLWIRGEARYDWSQFSHPFSDGTRSSQLTLSVATYVLF
jgi:Putative beta-barrel porin-2, OmpL-like. bbp2